MIQIHSTFSPCWPRRQPLAAQAATIGFDGPAVRPAGAGRPGPGRRLHAGSRTARRQAGRPAGHRAEGRRPAQARGRPTGGAQAIDKDKVDAIVGLSFSNVLMASLPRLAESGVVAIATNAGPSPLAGAQCKANLFSMAWQNDGAAEVDGQVRAGPRHQARLPDGAQLPGGQGHAGRVQALLQGPGGRRGLHPGQPARLFGRIAQLQAAKPDAVFVFYPGGMGINFVKQMSQAGLTASCRCTRVFTVDGTTCRRCARRPSGPSAARCTTRLWIHPATASSSPPSRQVQAHCRVFTRPRASTPRTCWTSPLRKAGGDAKKAARGRQGRRQRIQVGTRPVPLRQEQHAGSGLLRLRDHDATAASSPPG